MSDDLSARLAALEQLDEDLFDFPDVEGMADLLAAARTEAAAGTAPLAPSAPGDRSRPARAAALEPKAPLPSAAGGPPPRNAADLDEDLFGFGALLELEAGIDGDEAVDGDDHPAARAPVQPVAARGAAPARGARDSAAPAPRADAPPPGPPAPERGRAPQGAHGQAPVDSTPGDQSPLGQGPSGQVAPEPARAPAPALRASATPTSPVEAPRPQAQLASIRTDVPTGGALPPPPIVALSEIDLPPARSKLLWVLVACFLLANGGIFLLTQQQSRSVNETLITITSSLAEAVARGASAAPREPDVPLAAVDDAPAPRTGAPLIDAAEFSDTNELGIHNARRLIEQGAYAEARRNLFFILANQDRSRPLTPTMREDIDYLIALTYYDQGRSIAVEDPR